MHRCAVAAGQQRRAGWSANGAGSHPEDGDPLIPQISQEAPANMIGSSRPRVNAFMNRFRKLGFIDYNSHIRVHESLLNVFLRD